jgi:hypothetical protein
VAGYGALWGYFVWNTYANNTLIHSYPLSWGSAQWIVPQTEAPQGYFRKNLYITRKINHAWIKVAAPDSYTLTVNGQTVGKKTFHALNISGVYDITMYLHTGKNVIGVLVRRSTYPGTSKILVEGAYVDNLNQETRFVSDDAWKVKITEERQGNGNMVWTNPNFDDVNWPVAKIFGPSDKERIYPINVDYGATEESVTSTEIPPTHPELIINAPYGEWVWYPDPEVRTAYFRKSLNLSHRIREVWVRVAASERYSLEVNGILVSNIAQSINPADTQTTDPANTNVTIIPTGPTSPAVPGASGPTSKTSSKANQTSGSLDIYNITPFVYQGSNNLGVSVHGERTTQALLTDGLVVYQNGETFWFKSDSSWKTIPVANIGPQRSARANEASFHNALVVGRYPNLPWNILNKTTKIITLPGNLETLAWLSMSGYMLAGIFFILSLWAFSAYTRSRLHSTPMLSALILDTLAHIPSALFLGICYLLQFDVRFDYSFPFQSWILAVAILLLLGFKLAIMLEGKKVGKLLHMSTFLRGRFSIFPHFSPDALTLVTLEENKKFYFLCLVILVTCGIWLRIHNINFESINGDECGTLRDALTIIERGYAYRAAGPYYERLTVTYEMLPYPIALSFLLFGVSDFALRLPSALYGIFGIFLIFYVGSKLFNRRIGLLASAIFTFIPLSIHWAQNDRYPQPTHTLGLLVSYLFYQAISQERIKPRHIYPVAILYSWTFLTWEGTGFLMIALCLGLLAVRRKDFKWLKEPHLWGALIGIGTVVMVQSLRRKIYTARYLIVGESRLAGVSLTPVPLDPLYDPGYYVDNFFWAENHAIMMVLVQIGLPLFIANSRLRYLATILITDWFMFTNFFPLPTSRYLYHAQPYFIFLAVATCVYYGDYLISLGKGIASQTKTIVNTIILVVPPLVLFLATNPFILQLHRFSSMINIGVVDTRYRTYQSDQKTSNQYIRDHIREGDYVISSTPDVTRYYAGQSDAFIESFTNLPIVYAEKYEDPEFSDKSVDRSQRKPGFISLLGVEVIIRFQELKEAMNKHHRVWIAAVPNSMFIKLNTPEVLSYVNTNFKIVYESYNAKIYLWEK